MAYDAQQSKATDDQTPTTARGIGARALLAVTVAIPLIGLAVATWPSVQRAHDLSDDALALEEAAVNVETLTRLDGALFDEMSLTVVKSIGDELGIPPELTASVFGEDPADGMAGAIAETDALIATGGLASVEAQLAEIRQAPGSMAEIQLAYGDLRAEVRDALDWWLADLESNPAGISPELGREVELLSSGIALRGALADAYYAFFGLLFDIRDAPATELTRLIEARSRMDTAIADLSAAADLDPAVDARFRPALESSALVTFGGVVDDLIADRTASGVPERGVELNLANAFAMGPNLEAVAVGANRSATEALRAINDQAEAVFVEAEMIRDDAQTEMTRTYVVAAALAVASLATVVLVGRFIVRPLRRLEGEIDELQADSDPTERPIRGPREVQAATIALRRAATHFSLASEQARRLAAGELDAEVLDRRAEGGLGDSLQAAVDRLREALAHQNEFRRRLSHEASHDGLTQIPNRNASLSHLTHALARSKRSGSPLAVMFIDLDNFKAINDHSGHHAGDAVLIQVAQRLVNGVRDGDFVGRLGGDEFLVVTENSSPIADTVRSAERLLETLAEPIALLDDEVVVEASVGIAVAETVHLTAEELLRDADLAVYRAKASGRGGVELCDEELREQFVRDNDLANALRGAIDRDEFELHFQPVVGAAGHQPHGLEALVRWRRPDTGELVPPGLFIEFAERSSLIVDIDRWVLEAVARQLGEWRDDPRFADLPVAVNISGRHLTHPNLLDHVLEPLSNHGVEPSQLVVELTESALVNDLEAAAAVLRRLRDAGVAVAIDDFGTGYTSIAHLRALPFDILKIDRSFTTGAIHDAGEASIVKLIIDAGHLLGATVTAEGIETELEAQRLVDLGTDALQGFYFAKPLPADQVFEVDLISTAGTTD